MSRTAGDGTGVTATFEEVSPPDHMTTKEVAAYLRLKERRVYELVRQRAIPCTRITGKWIFPRVQIDLWLRGSLEGEAPPAGSYLGAPPVIAGSQDPLLDWAVKESDCGLALLPGGSLDGLARLSRGEAQVAGLHLFDPESGEHNLPALRSAKAGSGLVLIAWARRQQGLVLKKGYQINSINDLLEQKLLVMSRQEAAGSRRLFHHLIQAAGRASDELRLADEVARSETDLGLAILEGRAEAGFAVEAVARTLGLDFVPLAWERYDLLLRRRDYFEAPFQSLLTFGRGAAFQARAAQMGGYDVTDLGKVRFNGN
ncbi:MAG: helix-turn-helix transcriptional regulator [Pseudomonadota bacterium]